MTHTKQPAAAPIDLSTRADVAATPISHAAAPETTPGGSRDGAKKLLRGVLPLGIRKQIARVLAAQTWLSQRHWWSYELLRDLADRDPNAYHRFLWAHHLGYAETYEVALRFGPDRLHPTRRLLFDDLTACLDAHGVRPAAIRSVFEVGCSLGYNLRFLETDVFPEASVLDGCDIDKYAVERGCAHLASIDSRVRVFRADMGELGPHLADRIYDVTLCAGVLMYLKQSDAERVVAELLRHTGTVAAFAGLADPERDNALLSESRVRVHDGTFIHDIDDMVARAGGRVIQRRWEGSRALEGNTVYFVFAVPGAA